MHIKAKESKINSCKLEYVGWVEEILKLNYGILKIVVLFCNWVKENYNEMNTTTKRDEHMFTLISFSSVILIMNQSFVFPLHIKHVFFSKNPKE